jgi:hypothetical protein
MIIGLILLAAFGPVLWLVPSKRDRQLSALRDQARREGLVVELRRLPILNPTADERVTAGGRVKQPTVDCTAYMHSLRQRLQVVPGWRLLRGNQLPQIRPGWEFDPELKFPRSDFAHSDISRERDAFQASLKSLDGLFDALPDDVIGVELTPRSLILYWLESRSAQRSTVTALSELLSAAQDQLLALDDRFQAMLDDEDS